MSKILIQSIHNYARNEAMCALYEDVREVSKRFSLFDIYVELVGGELLLEDFRIKHVPSGLEYQVSFNAIQGKDPFTVSNVVMKLARLEEGCHSVGLGEAHNNKNALHIILCDAIVTMHLRKAFSAKVQS